MKNKVILKKRLFKLWTLCGLCIITAELIIASLALFTDRFIEDKRLLVVICIFIVMIATVLCYLQMIFRQYLKANVETVSFCKLFKREITIYWKDATVTDVVVHTQNGAKRTLTITDGTNKIVFSDVSDKSAQIINNLCKTARERYNTDNLTF